MLYELMKSLDEDSLDDYWYDFEILECEEILRELTDSEWSELIRAIPEKSARWNIRLVECLGDIHNGYEMECIKEMLCVPNEEVFVACVDTLRDMDIGLLPGNIVKDSKNRARNIRGKTDSLPEQLILDKFLKKVSIQEGSEPSVE